MQNLGVIADSYLKLLIMDKYSDRNVNIDYGFYRWQREGYVATWSSELLADKGSTADEEFRIGYDRCVEVH